MIKKLTLILSLFLISCSAKVDKDKLHLLNGYWEIKEVTFVDGAKKEYSINSTVDYIKLDSLSGFRKKVDPNLMAPLKPQTTPKLFLLEFLMTLFL